MKSKLKTVGLAETLYANVTENDLKIIEYLSQNPDCELTYKEISENCHISTSTVSRRIKLMEIEGLIVKFRTKKGTKVKWLGGIPSYEEELASATARRTSAASIAENYDLLILDRFSLFSLIFEDNYWEVFSNLKSGLNDVEILQNASNILPLDGIRRVLMTAEAHNLIKLKTLRQPAGNSPSLLFEPLYRIEEVNELYLNYLRIIRGLSSAISVNMEGWHDENTPHMYNNLLELTFKMFLGMEKSISENNDPNSKMILKLMLNNYENYSDLDKRSGEGSWRLLIKDTTDLIANSKKEMLLLHKDYSLKCKNQMLKEIR